MTKLNVFLMTWAAVSTMALLTVFVDNRALASLATYREGGEWVREETLARVVGACEALGYVNRRDQELLRRARLMLEEVHGIRQWNEDLSGGGHGQVRRVARGADEGSAGLEGGEGL